MKKLFISLLLGASVLLAKPVVTASILPTKYFIEQIAADTLEVNVMVGRGADPHTYEPRPKQMSDLERSELYFAIGIEFENTWLPRFEKSNKNLKIIPTQEGIEKIKMDSHHDHDDHKHEKAHSHGHKHGDHDKHDHDDHDHDALDPHIWLDPVQVKVQANTIADALIAKFPQNAELYRANLAKFQTRLDALDAYIANELKGLKNREFIVYHPSWGYFAKRYELEQVAIEIEGKEPKPAELKELISEAKEHGARVIFVAPQFSKKAAELIAKEVGAKVVEIDQLPLDWENELRKTAQILAQSLR